MRYIGSKANAIDFLDREIHARVGNVQNKIFADLLAGTVVVSKHFKQLGCRLITNDYMAFSYVLQVAYIKLNHTPTFEGLRPKLMSYDEVLAELNNLTPLEGFFFRNYCIEGTHGHQYQRNYFSANNAAKIDAILSKIREWTVAELLSSEEDSALRASLIDAVTRVSNISGTYGAFLKLDDKRKHKALWLEPIDFIESDKEHSCYNSDIFKLIDGLSGDILYLDPPYNTRQYPPYYHILETLSLDDDPAIYGKTGRRPYAGKMSPFCIQTQVRTAFFELMRRAKFEHVFLSYNTDGLLTVDQISNLLSPFGEMTVSFQDYRRFKSNSNGGAKNNLKEVLFHVKKAREPHKTRIEEGEWGGQKRERSL